MATVERASRDEVGRGVRSRSIGRLTPGDLAVLRIWLISRCAVLALSWPAMWVFQGSSKASRPWLGLWQQWDANWYQVIAQHGYSGTAGHPLRLEAAFFPGYPIVLAAVHLIVREWVISELLISLVAGGVAVLALGRVADRDYAPGSGSKAVLYLLVSPAAIFLAVGYSESLFLAFALTSWLAARNSRWPLAFLLAGAATLVRINGLFLCGALLVEIIRHAGPRRAQAFAALPLALLPLTGYEFFLRVKTGDWLAWLHAEAAGWQRRLTNPVAAFHTTWTAGFGHEFSAPTDFVFQLEPIALLAAVVTTVLLLTRRRWSEAVYAGLTTAALASSIWYESVPRALLLIWPLWCGLAVVASKKPWTGQLYLALAIPVSAVIGLLYLTGSWAG